MLVLELELLVEHLAQFGITGVIGNVGTVGIAGDVGIVFVLSVLGLRLASISASRRASSSCSLDFFSGAVIELLPVENDLLEEAARLIISRTWVIGAIELAPSSRVFATREESIGVASSRLLELLGLWKKMSLKSLFIFRR